MKSKPTFACVLKMGGDYLPEHVQALARQVELHTTIDYEFVCYSDIEIEGVKTISLEGDFMGWWAVPEVFRNQGPTIITGIDTVIRQNIDDLFRIAEDCRNDQFWMIRAFNPRNTYASGIMIYNGDWSWLWRDYQTAKASDNFTGEQDYTIDALTRIGVTPRILQDYVTGIYSYKKHCKKGIPADCKIILFHGHPRPHEVPSLWKSITSRSTGKIPRLWDNETVYILGGGPSLNNVDMDLIKDRNVLGVNQAYTLGDWVDVCYSGDKRWYGWNSKPLKKYKGIVVTSYPDFIPDPSSPTLNVGRISSYGISNKFPSHIAWNGNSGASALNVAYWLGASKIVLLGFDMRRIKNDFNWHDDYPPKARRKDTQRYPNPYVNFMACWRRVAVDAKRLGLEVVNATPNSRLKIFNQVPLEDTL